MLLLFSNALLFDPLTYQQLLSPDAVPVTMHLLGYFQSREAVPSIFTEREQSHLADVKRVVQLLQYLLLLLGVLFLALLRFSDVRVVFTRGFLLVVLIALLLAVLPFDTLFIRFHELFFPQGNWVFPADSTLIRLYPQSFFEAFFRQLLLLTTVFCAVLGLHGLTSLVQHHKP
jgi:integral membrane protein (TIGR01906 family)